MAKKLKLTVEVVPSSGDPVEHKVEVAASGASVKAVCEAAGISLKNKDLSVNGLPATPSTHVGPNDALQTKEKRRAATVQASERPQGS